MDVSRVPCTDVLVVVPQVLEPFCGAASASAEVTHHHGDAARPKGLEANVSGAIDRLHRLDGIARGPLMFVLVIGKPSACAAKVQVHVAFTAEFRIAAHMLHFLWCGGRGNEANLRGL